MLERLLIILAILTIIAVLCVIAIYKTIKKQVTRYQMKKSIDDIEAELKYHQEHGL